MNEIEKFFHMREVKYLIFLFAGPLTPGFVKLSKRSLPVTSELEDYSKKHCFAAKNSKI
jgi:hypothetical protein